MVFERARRIGRVFAVALLAWTAVDVLDYGACANHQHGFAPCAPRTVSGAAPAHEHGPSSPPEGHAGDCFCCSPYVDVQTPFHVTLQYSVAWPIPPDAVARPLIGASPWYHPPLG